MKYLFICAAYYDIAYIISRSKVMPQFFKNQIAYFYNKVLQMGLLWTQAW